MSTNNQLGISLSGGGYRATAYHLGTLKKLHAMNILEKATVISTISGGSITGAYYCLREKTKLAAEVSGLITYEQFKNDMSMMFEMLESAIALAYE